MVHITSFLHHTFISRRKTFSDNLVKIWRDDVILRHVTSFEFWKMTSRDVTWRHHVGFLPNSQEMLLLLILRSCENIKSFASFFEKLLKNCIFRFNMKIYRKMTPYLENIPIFSELLDLRLPNSLKTRQIDRN